VSATHELPAQVGEANPGEGTPDAPIQDVARRRIAGSRWAAVAVAGLVVAGGGAFAATHLGSTPEAKPTDPITLPISVAGMPQIADGGADLTQSADWQAKAKAAAGGTTIAARTYGKGGQLTRTIRVVAARTDLSGKLEQAWAAGSGSEVGRDRCTNNIQPAKGSAARVRPTVMLCWRTSASFSAYSLIIDPKSATPVTEADGAAALDDAWDAAGGR
jgi:hypothetical protein